MSDRTPGDQGKATGMKEGRISVRAVYTNGESSAPRVLVEINEGEHQILLTHEMAVLLANAIVEEAIVCAEVQRTPVGAIKH